MVRYSFRKDVRVLKGSEFTVAIRRGDCAADDTLVVFAVATALDRPARIGITIPKKAGNAVVRNRWKRLIRESFRTQVAHIPQGYDFIVRPKKNALPSWPAIQRAVPKLARRAASRAK